MTDEQKAAVRRATDWLEANPQRHIASEMSMTADGRSCRPNDPHAYCFCAIGRIGRELGGDLFGMVEVMDAAGLENPEQIWERNDRGGANSRYIFPDTTQGNPAVIPYLRKLAE